MKAIAEDPPLFEPGESYQYSLSHDVLAAMPAFVCGGIFREEGGDPIVRREFSFIEQKADGRDDESLGDRVGILTAVGVFQLNGF